LYSFSNKRDRTQLAVGVSKPYTYILGGEIIMSEMRNPITREENFSNPAGNVMMELQEADLNKFVAGAGETRNSGGVLCTSTAECYFGTLLKPCCPKK
jgi:hypothetical protein